MADTAVPPARPALAGLRVLDFARFMPGPFAAWLLADYGADVIRIESPREVAKQEALLGWSSTASARRRLARAAQVYARNKRSLQIDPTHPEGRAVIMELVRRADVVVEDYRPGVMAAMGYGYDTLSACNPRLVYCSVSFAGQTGPYSARPGHDPLALALAGVLGVLANSPQPQLPNIPVADVVAGCLAGFGILTALRAREQTGCGQWVDMAMSDAASVMLGASLWRNAGQLDIPRPQGQWLPKGGLWECADGQYLCTTDMEPRYWERFCEVIGRPDFGPQQSQRDAWPAMQQAIAAILKTQPRAHWIARLGAADTQFMPVYTVAEAFADPHNVARGLPVTLPVGDAGSVQQFAPPVKLSATPGQVRFPAGLPGADNAAILGELGYDAARIGALQAAGVLRE
jgi:crotonobetainyl-CoA:carnitine CoA-transferase CaiB-like acyl-CoA transferase